MCPRVGCRRAYKSLKNKLLSVHKQTLAAEDGFQEQPRAEAVKFFFFHAPLFSGSSLFTIYIFCPWDPTGGSTLLFSGCPMRTFSLILSLVMGHVTLNGQQGLKNCTYDAKSLRFLGVLRPHGKRGATVYVFYILIA